MIVFHSDLDNTLIYSCRRDIGKEKVCVEIYQGREVSFMTPESFELLKRIKEKTVFVPTTTRTEEQYARIDLGIGVPEYALVCNGGVLLEKGCENIAWYGESLSLIEESRRELEKAKECMERDEARILEVRNIRSLFLFTKSSMPEQSVKQLETELDLTKVDVFQNGAKMYVVPKGLDKGAAVRRFRKKMGADTVIAAGDSLFDIPMLAAADIGIAPEGLVSGQQDREDHRKILNVGKGKLLAEEALNYIWGKL